MEYYYVIKMDEFWKLEPSIIKFAHQKLPSKDYILIRVTSELTKYDEQFENIDQFNNWSVDNDFNPTDPVNEPITPYIPEVDDPILR